MPFKYNLHTPEEVKLLEQSKREMKIHLRCVNKERIAPLSINRR